MPIANYGVWKAQPLSYSYETRREDEVSPHLYLKFSNGKAGKAQAAINIKSGDTRDSRLVYWVVPALDHPIISELQALEDGFHSLQGASGRQSGNLRLDYIRGNLFQKRTGRILPHDIPGENNDIIDVLKPIIDEGISRKATIYLYGSRFDDGKGIHNVHMNQGSPRKFQKDNGVRQDGGFFLQFEDDWKAIFLGFASQAVHTKDGPPNPGDPIPQCGYKTWADFLDPEVPAEERENNDVTDTPVLISQALVNPPGPDNQPGIKPEAVFLTNRTAQTVDLTGWKIRNQAGQFEELPSGATLTAEGVSKEFRVPNCPLSNQGGVITLLNAQGFKVHGVSYTKVQAKREGSVVSFE
ncbi:yukj [Trichoderma arundinaceum]|uniref:Yukj n=1 Tax=Trichoderma arundinaceum TaxID=490622 RepID=A0A395P1C0_TRIAR|nr:yukj [Trichoderma arundinaceum]